MEFRSYLIDILIENKNFSIAIKEIYISLSLCPEHINSYRQLAIIYDKQNRKDIAISIENLALTIDPKNKWCHVHLISLLIANNNIDEAANIADKLVNIHKNWCVSYRQLSFVYDAKGDIEKAVFAAQKAFELDPNGPSIKSNLDKLSKKQSQLKIKN